MISVVESKLSAARILNVRRLKKQRGELSLNVKELLKAAEGLMLSSDCLTSF
jgi:hypothetical protein